MLFISHKTEDKAIANEVLRRARQRDYSKEQIFLDSDPESGIEAGAAWESKLFEKLKHTRAMIVLCSPNWLKSQWCPLELGYAKAMAISVFPIVIEPCEVGSTLSATQAIDLTTATDAVARDAAFERLWTALEEQHLGPKDNLPWPPPGEKDNCPFPGLMYFDEKHAPVFFGREQERDTVIKQLKAMRSSGVPRLLMIVGGSGSGKSSLLRAGVLPWLRHPTEQRDWLVLPTLRYGESPNEDVTLLARLAEILAARFPPDHSLRPDWKDLRNKFESDNVEQAARDFVDTTVDLYQAQPSSSAFQGRASTDAPTVLLPIDQFEELLTAAARPSALQFLRFLRTLLSRSNGRLLVVGTMRSDYLDVYEPHAESLKPPFLELYRLPPFPWERVAEVIVKPAKSVDVTFTEELITRLKGDAPNGDALPLLAFTLEKLFRQCASDQVIELSEYEQLGGMTGAISQAVARILPKDMPKETEHALRMSFVKHLAQVNEKDEFVRRPARWSDLPAAAKPLLEEFVRRERLLQRSGHKGELVEVTHEAIFRCWDQLKKWLQDDLPALRLRRRVETLAEEWHCSRSEANPKGDDGLLLTLAQVAALNEWLNQGDVILSDGENTFVEASREKRKSDEQREIERLHQLADAQTEKARKAEARRQAEVARAEDARAAARNQKRLTLWAFSAAAIAVSLFAVAVWLRHIANHERSIAVTARDDARQEALIANVHRLAAQAAALGDEFPQRRVLLAAEAARRSLQAKIPIPEAEQALRDGLSRIGGHPLRGHSKDISLLKFSSNSHWLVTGSEDHNAILWDVRNRPRDGSSVQFMLPGHAGTLSAATFSPDGRWLATIAKDEPDSTVRVWDIIALNSDGGTHPIVTLDHRGYVRVFFTPDSRSLITLDRRELENGEGDFEIRKCTFSPAPTGEIRSMRFTMRDERMTAAEVSSDNHWLAAATTGNQIAVWNLADVDNQVSPQWVLSAESPSQDILFSPESRWLCVGSNTGEARLWELAKTTTDTRKAHRVLTAAQKVAQKTTRPVVFSPDNHWLVTETENSAAYIWDLSRLDTPLAATVSVEFIPFTVGSVVRRYYGLNKAEFSNDGRWLLTKDGSAAILWELHKLVADYSYLPVVLPGRQSLSKVSISHDSRWLVGASAVFVFGGASRVDTPVYLWDLKLLAANPSAEPLTLRGNEGGFMSEVAFSPDSRWLVTGALDGSVRLWDMREPGSPVQPLSVRSHTGEVNAITVTSNGKWLITGGGWLDRKIVDNTIRIWDLPALCKGNSPQPIVLSENEGAVNGLLVSASNRWVVGTGFRSARLWNLEQLIAGERSASRVVPVDGQLEAAAISDDERWFVLALSGLDKPSRLLVWPLVELVNSDNVAPVSLETHAGNIKEIIIDPSSRWLVISKGGSSGMAWNLNEFSSDPKRGQHMLSEQKGEVNCARFTRDGKLLITGHEDGNVRIWKVNDLGNAAVQPQTLKTSSRSVSQMSVSPDGRWLVVAANESFKVLRPRLLLWDMATLAEEGSPEPVLLEGHERHIQEMIVSSDSHWLVTASADATVRVWDLRNPRSASIVLDNSSKPLVMTPENRWLVTGGPDESFRLWNMDVSELIDVAEQSAGRKLGSEERQRYQIPETSP